MLSIKNSLIQYLKQFYCNFQAVNLHILCLHYVTDDDGWITSYPSYALGYK